MQNKVYMYKKELYVCSPLPGDQDKGWHQVCLDIPHGYDRFQVAFEGISYGTQGDIAIDDVILSHGSCNLSSKVYLTI